MKDLSKIYVNLKNDLENLVDMVIVNDKQRKAVYNTLNEILNKYFT